MCPINSANSFPTDLDLVIVPVVSLNPKKAKKKLKKAARAEENVCVDSRLPVDKFDADSFDVVPAVSLNPKKTAKKTKPAAQAFPLISKMTTTLSAPAEFTPTLKLDGSKKSWYDITMDDDDDFCGAF